MEIQVFRFDIFLFLATEAKPEQWSKPRGSVSSSVNKQPNGSIKHSK